MYFVLFVVSSVTAGMILYGEYNWPDAWKCVGFFVGLCVTFVGVYFVGKKNELQIKQVDRDRLLGNSQSIEVSIADYTNRGCGQPCDEMRHSRRCT